VLTYNLTGCRARTHDLPKLNGRCPFCCGHEADTPPEILSYPENGNGHWNLRVVPNKFPTLRVEDLFWAFRDRILELKRDSRLRYVLLFKNHGEAAGASLEHTHSQIIALPVVPIQVQEELDGARRYYSFKERCVFCDIVRRESAAVARVILETDQLLVISPYAPRFPFETWVVPRAHNSHFESAQPSLIQSLAWAMRAIIRKMEKVLEYPAYDFLIHSAPIHAAPLEHYNQRSSYAMPGSEAAANRGAIQ